MTNEDIVVSVEDRAGTICLNRPEKFNALRQLIFAELIAPVDELVADDVRVIVLTAAGTKAFCTGTDLEAEEGMRAVLAARDTPYGDR